MKTRISLWDNARFILMALVVVGHMITTTRMDSTLAYAIYAYLYLFHMPAMILVSGYFSKAELNRNAVRATLGLLATWVTFEIIWIFYRWVIDGNAFSNTFLIVPSWTLWFLVTLITMRILLPFIAALKHPLIVSLIIALVAGLSPVIGTEFSVMRTMSFLPFFVFGWLAREHGWLAGHRFLNPSVALKAGAWAVLALIALAFALVPDLRNLFRLDVWITWRDDYASLLDLGFWQTPVVGLALRSLFIAIAFVMTLAVLVVVPRRPSVLTVWGTRTLYLYLLHGFVVYALRHYGVIDVIGELGALGTLILITMGVALSMLLSMAWVQKLTRPVIEPNINWMLAKVPAEPSKV